MDQHMLSIEDFNDSNSEDMESYRLHFTRDVHDELDLNSDLNQLLENTSSPQNFSDNWTENSIFSSLKEEPGNFFAENNPGPSRSSLCTSPSSMSSGSSIQQQFRNEFISQRPETPLDSVKLDDINNPQGLRAQLDSLASFNLDSNGIGEDDMDGTGFYFSNDYLSSPTTAATDTTDVDPGQFFVQAAFPKEDDDLQYTLSPSSTMNTHIISNDPPSMVKRKRNNFLSSTSGNSSGTSRGYSLTTKTKSDKNLFLNSNQLLSANSIKNEDLADYSCKSPTFFATTTHNNRGTLVNADTISSSSNGANLQIKSGMKRKITGTPFYVCEPTAKTNQRVISVRSIDKNSLKTAAATGATRAALDLQEVFQVKPKSDFDGDAEVKASPFSQRIKINNSTFQIQNILKQTNSNLKVKRIQNGEMIPANICIKTEPGEAQQFVKITQHTSQQLPPTPPSSSGSDNESNNSPRATKQANCNKISSGTASSSATATAAGNSSSKSSPTLIRVHPSSMAAGGLATQLMTTPQRLTQTHGPLMLTDEEKRTLIAEGYKVPTKLPLTKCEEKSLKKVRRKIKNKISAQESRRKKKEYVEKLEKKMNTTDKENQNLRQQVSSLEKSNMSLLQQLKSLQSLISGKMPKSTKAATTQTSSCLMMLALSFVFFVGGWLPMLSETSSKSYLPSSSASSDDYTNSNIRSRVLMSYQEEQQQDESTEMMVLDGNDAADSCSTADLSACQVNQWLNNKKIKILPAKAIKVGVGDTYDKGRNNLANINDTGEQHLASKIIANTMEPRTAADVIASRKLTAGSSSSGSNGRVEVLIPVTSGGALDMVRKLSAQYIIKE